jgi:peptidoglycan/xylan/chitin deacetylase (PgdA/CDA1 family)
MKTISLCYHDVIVNQDPDASGFPGASAASYKLEKDTLQQHLRSLASTPSIRVSAVTALDTADNQTMPLLLTFDDGGISAVTETRGILQQHDWPGHFFITAGMIGQPGFVSAEDIRLLHQQGHLIGSHSWSHPARISHCDSDTLRREWTDSVVLLSEIIGEPVTLASVPGGYYSPRVAEAARAAGIRFLFTSEPEKRVRELDGMKIFGRYSIQRHTTATTVQALASTRLSRAQLWQYGYWNSKKLAKRFGGTVWLRLREAWWARQRR